MDLNKIPSEVFGNCFNISNNQINILNERMSLKSFLKSNPIFYESEYCEINDKNVVANFVDFIDKSKLRGIRVAKENIIDFLE